MVNDLSSLSFSDLVECLKQSKDFPCTNFRFKGVILSDDADDIEQFLSIWGKSVCAFGVKIENAKDVEMLRNFLGKTSHLKKLHIHFDGSDYYEQRIEPAVHLFANSYEFRLYAE